MFIVCHFLWIRNLDIAWLGPLVEDLSQVSVKLWAGAAVYLKSQPGKYLLSNLLTWFLTGFSTSQVVRLAVRVHLQFLIMCAAPKSSSQHGRWFHQNEPSDKVREHLRETKGTVFYNLILDVTSHFGCILFMRSKSLDPAYTREKGNPHSCKYWEAGVIGGHFRSRVSRIAK